MSRTSRGLAHTAAADTTVSLAEAIAMRFGQRRDSVDRCTPKATRSLADLWNARVDHGAPSVTMKNVGRAKPRIFVIQHVAALLGLVS